MKPLAKALIALVALEHLMFFVLESFFWTSDFGMKTFGTTPALAESSKVLAMNQGVYNGFLAACLGVARDERDVRARLARRATGARVRDVRARVRRRRRRAR